MNRTLVLVALSAAALSLCACKTTGDIITVKDTTGGVHINAPAQQLDAGYNQGKVALIPAVDGKGVAISQASPCNVQTGLSVYDIQNGSASASINTTANGASTSIAINEATIGGYAAILAAAGGGQAPSPAAITAMNDCSKSIPQQSAGSAAAAAALAAAAAPAATTSSASK